jgi:hypothetical protein
LAIQSNLCPFVATTLSFIAENRSRLKWRFPVADHPTPREQARREIASTLWQTGNRADIERALADAFAQGQQEERDRWHRAVHRIVNESCGCGGCGPNDPEVCPACMVWHRLVAVDPTLLDAVFGGEGRKERAMKALVLCVNGDGRPVCPPSKVVCRECLDKIGGNLRRLLDEATGAKPRSEEGWK